MLDEFAVQIMKTLLNEMSAVTPDGDVDHKTRLAALKEARAFVQSILPRLTQEDKNTFSHAMAQEMKDKLSLIIVQEKKLTELPDVIPAHGE